MPRLENTKWCTEHSSWTNAPRASGQCKRQQLYLKTRILLVLNILFRCHLQRSCLWIVIIVQRSKWLRLSSLWKWKANIAWPAFPSLTSCVSISALPRSLLRFVFIHCVWGRLFSLSITSSMYLYMYVVVLLIIVKWKVIIGQTRQFSASLNNIYIFTCVSVVQFSIYINTYWMVLAII